MSSGLYITLTASGKDVVDNGTPEFNYIKSLNPIMHEHVPSKWFVRIGSEPEPPNYETVVDKDRVLLASANLNDIPAEDLARLEKRGYVTVTSASVNPYRRSWSIF